MSAPTGGLRHRRRTPAIVALLAALLVIGPALVSQLGAGAQPVMNPGPLNLKITGGFVDINGTDFDLTPSELPACSDGEDNDEDGATDFPADAQCANAGDNSELAGGNQPKEDTTISGTISASGAVTIPQSGIYFPPAYLESSGAVLTARIQPTGAGSGNLNPLTGLATMSISVRVKLEGSPSGVSLGDSCIIGPLNLAVTTGTTNPPAPNTPITGVPYDADAGTATMVNNSFSVPAASGCGPLGLANGPINDELGLPAAGGKNTARLEGAVNPPIGKGVRAAFTPSVTSGPAPLTVNFNGTSSAAAKTITSYAWDFGNGETATGPTAFTTYATPGTYDSKLTITDADGDTDVKIVPITVEEPPNIAPTAAIGTSGASGNAPFAVSFSGSGSSDPDGTITDYAWDFGNGETATGEAASTTYATEGSYTATLTVTDDKGETGTATQVITVAPKPNVPPTAVATVVSVVGTIPMTVNLSAAASTDSDGTIASYEWDFGNGQTATGVTTQVTYPTAGLYTVILTVTDNQGGVGTQTVAVDVSTDPNIAPTAQLSASATSGIAPLTVDFDGSASSDLDGTIVGYSWNFGNGQSGSGTDPSVTYTIPGTYLVTLTVTDNRGATSNASTSVVVSKPPNQSPTAALAATPSTGTAPLLVQLSSAGSTDPDGAISSYSWNLGNGQTGTGPSPSVVYATAGTYTVTLTVTDNDGATNAKSTSVTVVAANVVPTAVIQATPTSGSAPMLVTVNGASSTDPDGSIVSYAWDFGNGQTATGATASTTYTSTGTFTLRLTVTDNSGATRSTTTSIVVSGSNQKPVPALLALPTSGPAPLLVTVNAHGSTDPDGSIVSYAWDFGNGQTAQGLQSQVTYTTAGTYVITLTVKDNKNATATATETIVVDPPLTVTDRVRLQFNGSVSYAYDGRINGGNLRVTRDNLGPVRVYGSATFTGPNNSSASMTLDVNRFLWFNSYLGNVTVNDSANGVSNVTTPLVFQSLTRPSATSVRANVSWTPPGGQAYTFAFTIDDRV
ncbi:MAG: PKD domain-containing protein [Microthrixaceae bacterium]